jgi:class 3 adenylate cyclase
MPTRTAVQRRLSAIMFTDIVGFSRLMGQDEGHALQVLDVQRDLVPPLVQAFEGRILKEMGDGLLVVFASTVHAVQCALEIQDAIRRRNVDARLPFQIRIGIHLGDVVVMGDDILGEGVNIASRIEPLASPGGICVTQAVYQSVKSTLSVEGGRIDAVRLKNIDEEYTLYTIPRSDTAPAAHKSAARVCAGGSRG